MLQDLALFVMESRPLVNRYADHESDIKNCLPRKVSEKMAI